MDQPSMSEVARSSSLPWEEGMRHSADSTGHTDIVKRERRANVHRHLAIVFREDRACTKQCLTMKHKQRERWGEGEIEERYKGRVAFGHTFVDSFGFGTPNSSRANRASSSVRW